MEIIIDRLLHGGMADAAREAIRLLRLAGSRGLNPEELVDCMYGVSLVGAGPVPPIRSIQSAYFDSNPSHDHRYLLLYGQRLIYAGAVEEGLGYVRKSIELAPGRETQIVHNILLGCFGYILGLPEVMEEASRAARRLCKAERLSVPLRVHMTEAQLVAMSLGAKEGFEVMNSVPAWLVAEEKDIWAASKWHWLAGRLKLQMALSGNCLNREFLRDAITYFNEALRLQIVSGINLGDLNLDAPANDAYRSLAIRLGSGGDADLPCSAAYDDAESDFSSASHERASAIMNDLAEFIEDPVPANADAATFNLWKLLDTGCVTAGEAAALIGQVHNALRPEIGDETWKAVVAPSRAQAKVLLANQLELANDPECLALYKEAARLAEGDHHVRGYVLGQMERAVMRFNLSHAGPGIAEMRDRELYRVVLPRPLLSIRELLCDVRPHSAPRARRPATFLTVAHAAVFFRMQLVEAVDAILDGQTPKMEHLDGEIIWRPEFHLSRMRNVMNLDDALVATFQSIRPSLSSYESARLIGTNPAKVQRHLRSVCALQV